MSQRAGARKRLPSWVIGLVLVIVLAIASLLAFTKQLPWGDAYEVQAVFASAQNLRPSSPVRIAGVKVGKVTEVEHLTSAETRGAPGAGRRATQPTTDEGAPGEQAAVVTMELDRGRAAAARATRTFKLRPRLFLEGNYFVDLEPGSPNADEVDDGHTFPVNQTSYSVQLDQVLTTLQGDVRANLQVLPRPVRQRADQARRRRGLPRALPHLAAVLQVHLAGQRGVPRHRAAATSAA